MLKKIFSGRVLFGLIFVTMVLSTIYVAVRIAYAPMVAPVGEAGARVKGDYTLMLIQCISGTLALLLPSFITRRFNIEIPSSMIIAYALFLYCAVYLGEVRSFYYAIPHWDTILHTFSGAMLGALGLALISFLNKTDGIPVSLSPLFVALFAFCFAVALGAIWEIYEFFIDFFFHTNMQKFAPEDGAPLIGQTALMDTMKDMIVDAIGAFAFAVFGYLALKSRTDWYDRFALRRKRS